MWNKNKLTRKQKIDFIQLLGDLLVNGFSLQQALAFFINANLFSHVILEVLQQDLQQGKSLAKSFSVLQYSNDQILQIELAESHGDLAQTLLGIAQQMRLVQRQQENFIKAISYPLLLLVFLIVLLLGMRFFLLPQLLASGMLQADSFSVQLIHAVPVIGLILIILLLLLMMAWRSWGKSQNYLMRFSLLTRIPFVGRLFSNYYSAYFALEWGKLFQQGLELQQIIECLLVIEGRSLMQELAADLKNRLAQGKTLAEELNRYPFLTKEFSRIVFQGEARGNLGKELLTYSQFVWQRFFNQLEFLCSWLQPLIFLLVALLIVSLYLTMLLPLTNLEGIL
ncbi:competence type IV pilus assembly protein ComGB [Enterococcus dongliensis]|uniref:Competence type IV pilus assembly protein ComGB n=1 Tax=Enterococcus dongliensis TaxID=2559925 RepID=A0AAP5NL29_9ENTE|nr:competence type IV pilus assembly protein ComGB [Enterococcus dongliensis]MDT2596285.1 competence type IV pilus assembly protein ComGB [Enterococcus dongliensis]MDT2604326.1 competence type IV pilus assembly protein ComGB [Enterococcus dongliensis]MDT2634796.1 competence type IV pilus assembly protein ComGB [Enterococcus dongliensis]MDT2637907.1 competence type IV pilus assembly protein ComGB [Enterococcus dongliensis]MDT2642855.1 competence type IV pilus assembly protein ComGB [Enterococcu